MPASTETIALIAAGGTAVGALIGSSVGGVMDVALDRVRERRDAKVGARLVRADLAVAASVLKDAELEGQWWVFFDTPMDGWAAHRASLSARLSDADFELVTQAVIELERFNSKMAEAPRRPGEPYWRVPKSADALRTMRQNATAAYNALAARAKGERVSGLLHD